MMQRKGLRPRFRKLERLAGRPLNSTTTKTRRALGLSGIESLLENEEGNSTHCARRKSERILGSQATETTRRVQRGLGL